MARSRKMKLYNGRKRLSEGKARCMALAYLVEEDELEVLDFVVEAGVVEDDLQADQFGLLWLMISHIRFDSARGGARLHAGGARFDGRGRITIRRRGVVPLLHRLLNKAAFVPFFREGRIAE